MKKIVEIDESEGLESLLGELVTLLCMNYFYTGKLVGVNETCVKLEEPFIIYDTGEWNSDTWADSQKLPTQSIYVNISSIEAFGVLK